MQASNQGTIIEHDGWQSKAELRGMPWPNVVKVWPDDGELGDAVTMMPATRIAVCQCGSPHTIGPEERIRECNCGRVWARGSEFLFRNVRLIEQIAKHPHLTDEYKAELLRGDQP